MSYKQYLKGRAVSLGLILVFLVASAIVALYSMATQPPRTISIEMPDRFAYKSEDNPADGTLPLSDETRAELRLSNVKLDAAKSRMTGEMEVYLTPNENYYAKSTTGAMGDIDAEKALETMSALEKIDAVPVWFSHMQRVPGQKESRYVDVGGSDSIIKMVVTDFKDEFEMKGKGPFTWTAEPLTDSFWYPFDSYKLYVRLLIFVPLDIDRKQAEEKPDVLFDHYFDRTVDYMSLEFAGANLVPDLTAKEYGDPEHKEIGDQFEIKLFRPFLARAYTVFVIVLMAFGLVYLYFFKDIEGSAGDLLGFFVAALGTRAILLSGVDFSPVLLDYVVVFFSILATGVVFGRWIDKRLPALRRKNISGRHSLPALHRDASI